MKKNKDTMSFMLVILLSAGIAVNLNAAEAVADQGEVAAAAAEEPQKCPICLDDKPVSECIALHNIYNADGSLWGNHLTCIDCAKEYLRANPGNPTCPICRVDIDRSNIQRIMRTPSPTGADAAVEENPEEREIARLRAERIELGRAFGETQDRDERNRLTRRLSEVTREITRLQEQQRLAARYRDILRTQAMMMQGMMQGVTFGPVQQAPAYVNFGPVRQAPVYRDLELQAGPRQQVAVPRQQAPAQPLPYVPVYDMRYTGTAEDFYS